LQEAHCISSAKLHIFALQSPKIRTSEIKEGVLTEKLYTPTMYESTTLQIVQNLSIDGTYQNKLKTG
jgi:hypothetical protein